MTWKKIPLKRWAWSYFRLFLILTVIHFGLLVAGCTEEGVSAAMKLVYSAFKFTVMLPANLVLTNFDALVEDSFLHFAWIHLGNTLVYMLAYALWYRITNKEKEGDEQFVMEKEESPKVF